MPEYGMLPIPDKLLREGVRDMVRISDARMSGTSYGTCVLHIAPESFVGGPLALVENGDLISLDVGQRRLQLEVGEAELLRRKLAWTPPPRIFERGYGALYSEHIGQADQGCDFDFLAREGRRRGTGRRLMRQLGPRHHRSVREARDLSPGFARTSWPRRRALWTSSGHRRRREGEPVEIFEGSVTDPEVLDAACRGADAVVHLGGFAGDAPWPDLSEVNVGGTLQVLEAARRHDLRRVVVASSNHAVGFHTRGAQPLADDVAPMPDSLYGASKAAGEALCQFYAVNFAMDVICLRIGSCFDAPLSHRMLSTWLSPADFVRLTKASLSGSMPGLPARLGRVREQPPLVVHGGWRRHRLSTGGQRREIRRDVPRAPA